MFYVNCWPETSHSGPYNKKRNRKCTAYMSTGIKYNNAEEKIELAVQNCRMNKIANNFTTTQGVLAMPLIKIKWKNSIETGRRE